MSASSALIDRWRAHLALDRRRSVHTVRAYQATAERLVAFLERHRGEAVSQDMLASLEREQSHRGMPKVGRGDADSVHSLVFEDAAKVIHPLTRRGLFVRHHLKPTLKTDRIDLGEIGDLDIRQGQQGLNVRHPTAECDDGHLELVTSAVSCTKPRRGEGGTQAEHGGVIEQSSAVHHT